MPELDINFIEKPYIVQIEDFAKYKKNREPIKVLWYPGFTLVVKTVRNPLPKVMRIFLPLMILGLFSRMTSEVDEYHDRLNNLALCLLTFITIMETTRSELPDISNLTTSDKYLISYMLMSLVPVLDKTLGIGEGSCQALDGEIGLDVDHCELYDHTVRQYLKWGLMIIQIAMFINMLRKYCKISVMLDMSPPE